MQFKLARFYPQEIIACRARRCGRRSSARSCSRKAELRPRVALRRRPVPARGGLATACGSSAAASWRRAVAASPACAWCSRRKKSSHEMNRVSQQEFRAVSDVLEIASIHFVGWNVWLLSTSCFMKKIYSIYWCGTSFNVHETLLKLDLALLRANQTISIFYVAIAFKIW